MQLPSEVEAVGRHKTLLQMMEGMVLHQEVVEAVENQIQILQ